jgi:hypothetical protein
MEIVLLHFLKIDLALSAISSICRTNGCYQQKKLAPG